MKYDSISGLFTAIADEIRAKDGSSELINPQDLPERVKNLSGIPDVPTLECWKITPRDQDDKYKLFDFLALGGEGFSNLSLAVTEMDGVIYGGSYIVFGSGGGWVRDQIFYIAFVNKGDGYYMGFVNELREYVLGACGEQMSISEFLSIVARAENYGE